MNRIKELLQQTSKILNLEENDTINNEFIEEKNYNEIKLPFIPSNLTSKETGNPIRDLLNQYSEFNSIGRLLNQRIGNLNNSNFLELPKDNQIYEIINNINHIKNQRISSIFTGNPISDLLDQKCLPVIEEKKKKKEEEEEE